jgi:methyl-accepting chemotaxis protein
MLEKLKVRQRLYLILAVSVIGVAALICVALNQLRDQMIADHEFRVTHLVQTIYTAVEAYQKLEASGKMSQADAQAAAKAALVNIRFGNNEGFYIFNKDGVGMYHAMIPKFNGLDTCNSAEPVMKGVCASIRKSVADKDKPLEPTRVVSIDPKTGAPVEKIVASRYLDSWGWLIGTSLVINNIDAVFTQALYKFLAIAAGVLAVIVLLSVLVARSITRQLGGEPGEAVAVMRRVAQGDLTVEVNTDKSNAGSLLAALSTMLASLRVMMSGMAASSAQVAAESRSISGASRKVSEAAQRQTDATTEMAAAMEEMTASIEQISQSAKETESNSSTAASLAERGTKVVGEAAGEINHVAATVENASGKISALVKSAEEVGEIANVIKEIANQTNLLALNAAIEAARAGEQGRGFAVVADEVRKLAERTSEATIKIEEIIGAIRAETVSAIEAMQAAGPQVAAGVDKAQSAEALLREIMASAGATLSRIRDVASAAREQSTASNAIAAQVESVAQMVEHTTDSTVATAHSVEKLEQLAADLQSQVGKFRFA